MGRRPLSPKGRRVQVTVLLSPEQAEGLSARGGSVRGGLLRAVAAYLEPEPPTQSVVASAPAATPAPRKAGRPKPAASRPAPPPAASAAVGLCPRCRRIGVACCEECRKGVRQPHWGGEGDG